MFMLTYGTKLCINDALHSPKSKRYFLRFKDICCNKFHIERVYENNTEYLYINYSDLGQNCIKEKFSTLSPKLNIGEVFYSLIWLILCDDKAIKSYTVMNQKIYDSKVFILWNDHLGHLSSIIVNRIVENSHGNPLKNLKILLSNENNYTTCSHGKLVVRPFSFKIGLNLHHSFKEFR